MEGLIIGIFFMVLANVVAVVALLAMSRRLERTLRSNMDKMNDLLELGK